MKVSLSQKAAWFFFLQLVVILSAQVALARPTNINPRAEALAKMLSPSIGKNAQGDVEGRMKKILEALWVSESSNGPSGSTLLDTAYRLREDISPSLRDACRTNMSRQFERAQMMGLFNNAKKMTGEITKGRDIGEKVVYERIVPAAIVPEFKNSLANIRLVGPSDRRTSDKPEDLDARTVDTAKRFMQIVSTQANTKKALAEEAGRERRESSPFMMGLTEKEHAALWKEKGGGDPENVSRMPGIMASAKKTITRVGAGVNEVAAKVVNRSAWPTEIEVDFRMIGYDAGTREYFELSKLQRKIKLLSNEERELSLQGKTLPEIKKKGKIIQHRTRYRGWVLTISHNGKVFSSQANDPTMLRAYGKEVKREG